MRQRLKTHPSLFPSNYSFSGIFQTCSFGMCYFIFVLWLFFLNVWFSLEVSILKDYRRVITGLTQRRPGATLLDEHRRRPPPLHAGPSAWRGQRPQGPWVPVQLRGSAPESTPRARKQWPLGPRFGGVRSARRAAGHPWRGRMWSVWGGWRCALRSGRFAPGTRSQAPRRLDLTSAGCASGATFGLGAAPPSGRARVSAGRP